MSIATTWHLLMTTTNLSSSGAGVSTPLLTGIPWSPSTKLRKKKEEEEEEEEGEKSPLKAQYWLRPFPFKSP
jgi:hypothetical protein